jgi:hypothetical protein
VSIGDLIVQEMKKTIIDYYNMNDFFKCTKATLKYWTIIVDRTSDKSELMNELVLEKGFFAGFGEMFTSNSAITHQRIKKLERLCFLIYAGPLDKYQNKVEMLIDNMSEVIKNSDRANPALIILILFCLRILVLRLSQQRLTELFRNIWPILITLLMQIFEKSDKDK